MEANILFDQDFAAPHPCPRPILRISLHDQFPALQANPSKIAGIPLDDQSFSLGKAKANEIDLRFQFREFQEDLLFLGIEAILGRPISMKKMEIAQQIGLILLILLMFFAFYNDLLRIFSPGGFNF